VFEDKADEYRAWAAQCLTMAARAKSDEDRQPWLELADKWQRLANEVGQRNRVRQQAQQPQPTKDSN
jgi:NAD-dependent oxidoreductase involved in siderophore biosynthesis